MLILLIEDDRKMADFLADGLRQSGFSVEVAYDGETGLEAAAVEDFDLLIIDMILPGMDGVAVCREVRKRTPDIPILFLTAQETVEDKVRGLEAGADDYLTKPFSFMELTARIQSLLRRRSRPFEKLAIDDLEMNVSSRTVTRGGERVELSNKEFAILEMFLRNKNRLLTLAAITERVWDIHFDRGTNLIQVYMTNLRKKLDCGTKKKLIHTVRGSGYIMKEPE